MARNVIVSREDAVNICRLYEDVKRCERLFERNQSGSFMTIVLKSADNEAVVQAFERMKSRIAPEPDKSETAEPEAE